MNRLLSLVILIFISYNGFSQTPACLGDKGILEWFLYGDIIGTVDRNPHYPQNPSAIEIIRKLETEQNFNDYYASIIRGFIMTPVSGTYYLNVTGSDYVEFYFSSNEFPENTELLIETDWTSYSQHDRYLSQTDTLDLIAGQYYFFELHHRENTGSEQARISWITPFGIDEWRTIGEDYIYTYNCNELCPNKGIACDDNNDNTISDTYDDACNCFGTPVELPECVGDKGKLQALYYDGIEGSYIIDLLNASSYPLQPSRAGILDQLRLPSQSNYDNFGSTVKAFLKVPVSGTYEFGAIGNSRSELYLSLTGDYSDIALIANSSGMTTSVDLDAAKFYYIKIIHKESENSEEFAALWKTPFYHDDAWKYIDDAYLFQYGCDLACMPEGTPCDDGNVETINDAFDENCNCSGIYCPDGDCPESTKFAHYDACASTGKHSTHPDDSWLSCNESESMNSERNTAHWIQYDLGSVMPIGESHIWNYNVTNQVEKGFKEVAIDLSVDSENWEQFGVFEWLPATGLSDYVGFDGPDFTGNSARYILLTAISNWEDGDCSGFSEIEFKVAYCPTEGTPCNDNNINTENDRYDSNCICKGSDVSSIEIYEDNASLKLFPNPSNGWTNIVFNLHETSLIDLDVYDHTGRLLVRLIHRQQYVAGSHQKSFPVQNLQQGYYIVRLKTSKSVITQKLLVSE